MEISQKHQRSSTREARDSASPAHTIANMGVVLRFTSYQARTSYEIDVAEDVKAVYVFLSSQSSTLRDPREDGILHPITNAIGPSHASICFHLRPSPSNRNLDER